jgi:hypothetical protein
MVNDYVVVKDGKEVIYKFEESERHSIAHEEFFNNLLTPFYYDINDLWRHIYEAANDEAKELKEREPGKYRSLVKTLALVMDHGITNCNSVGGFVDRELNKWLPGDDEHLTTVTTEKPSVILTKFSAIGGEVIPSVLK